MGRRSVVPSFVVFQGQDSTVNFNSLDSECQTVDVMAYDLTIDPTVKGTVTIQYSNENLLANAVWHNLNFAVSTAVDGSIDTEYRFQIDVSFKRVRLKWVNGSGTGLMTAKVYGLTRGA